MIRLMPRGNPYRLYIHLAFTYSVSPSSVVGCELGPAPPFLLMRVLEVDWSRALSLVCEVAFRWLIFLIGPPRFDWYVVRWLGG
jgi:hypothetical protein